MSRDHQQPRLTYSAFISTIAFITSMSLALAYAYAHGHHELPGVSLASAQQAQQGPRGPRGLRGPAGPPGAATSSSVPAAASSGTSIAAQFASLAETVRKDHEKIAALCENIISTDAVLNTSAKPPAACLAYGPADS